MHTVRNGLLTSAAALGVATVVGARVVRATQERSFRSWLIEQGMWLTGMKCRTAAKAEQGMAYREAQ